MRCVTVNDGVLFPGIPFPHGVITLGRRAPAVDGCWEATVEAMRGDAPKLEGDRIHWAGATGVERDQMVWRLRGARENLECGALLVLVTFWHGGGVTASADVDYGTSECLAHGWSSSRVRTSRVNEYLLIVRLGERITITLPDKKGVKVLVNNGGNAELTDVPTIT